MSPEGESGDGSPPFKTRFCEDFWGDDGFSAMPARRFGEKTVVLTFPSADLTKRRLLRRIRAPIWQNDGRCGVSVRGFGETTVVPGNPRAETSKRQFF